MKGGQTSVMTGLESSLNNQKKSLGMGKDDYEDLMMDIEKDYGLNGINFSSSEKEKSITDTVEKKRPHHIQNIKINTNDDEDLEFDPRSMGQKPDDPTSKTYVDKTFSQKQSISKENTIETAKLKPGNLNESSEFDIDML